MVQWVLFVVTIQVTFGTLRTDIRAPIWAQTFQIFWRIFPGRVIPDDGFLFENILGESVWQYRFLKEERLKMHLLDAVKSKFFSQKSVLVFAQYKHARASKDATYD